MEVQPAPLWVADLVEQASVSYRARDYGRSRELALRGLAERPDDARLLQLAGQSSLGLNLDAEEPITYLKRATEIAPGDVDAWQGLSVALVNAGRNGEAAQALAQVLRLRPDDTRALIDLAHSLHALGQVETAISMLRRVVELEPGHVGALRSLVDILRESGQRAAALEAAQAIARVRPDDVVATLDVAELNRELGNFSAAVAEYSRLLTVEPETEHAAYAYHGMIHVEIQRSSWRRALTLAIDVTRLDRGELTTQLLAFIAARLFGDAGRPSPAQTTIEAALAAEHAEHRRAHAEQLVSA